MSKAFTNENAETPGDEFVPPYRSGELPLTSKNYTTPQGYRRLLEEWERLTQTERPVLLTDKRRLREIDWRIQYLKQRIDRAEVIDPAARKPVDQVFFGATVVYANAQGERKTIAIVGVEESDAARGYVSFVSPLAKALLRAHEGDTVSLLKPDGVEELEILEVHYRALPEAP